jgi:hypothetical protein
LICQGGGSHPFIRKREKRKRASGVLKNQLECGLVGEMKNSLMNVAFMFFQGSPKNENIMNACMFRWNENNNEILSASVSR